MRAFLSPVRLCPTPGILSPGQPAHSPVHKLARRNRPILSPRIESPLTARDECRLPARPAAIPADGSSAHRIQRALAPCLSGHQHPLAAVHNFCWPPVGIVLGSRRRDRFLPSMVWFWLLCLSLPTGPKRPVY